MASTEVTMNFYQFLPHISFCYEFEGIDRDFLQSLHEITDFTGENEIVNSKVQLQCKISHFSAGLKFKQCMLCFSLFQLAVVNLLFLYACVDSAIPFSRAFFLFQVSRI